MPNRAIVFEGREIENAIKTSIREANDNIYQSPLDGRSYCVGLIMTKAIELYPVFLKPNSNDFILYVANNKTEPDSNVNIALKTNDLTNNEEYPEWPDGLDFVYFGKLQLETLLRNNLYHPKKQGGIYLPKYRIAISSAEIEYGPDLQVTGRGEFSGKYSTFKAVNVNESAPVNDAGINENLINPNRNSNNIMPPGAIVAPGTLVAMPCPPDWYGPSPDLAINIDFGSIKSGKKSKDDNNQTL